jgi:two-component system, NarL family, sensor kinase
MGQTYRSEIASQGNLNRNLQTLIWLAAAVGITGALVAIGTGIRFAVMSGDASGVLSHLVLNPFVTIVYSIIGVLVSSRHPRNPIGWIFLAVGVFYSLTALSGVIQNYASTSAILHDSLAASFSQWLNNWVWIPAVFLPTIFVFLLFPNGRMISHHWHIVLLASATGLASLMVGAAFHPGPLESLGTGLNPFGVPGAAGVMELLVNIGYALLVPGLCASLVSFVLRFRQSEGIEHQQMKWLLYALFFMVLGLIFGSILWYAFPGNALAGEAGIAIFSLTILGIAVAAGIAILRYRLYDIDLVINRTLVYGVLTLGVVFIYVLLVGGLGSLFQAQGSPLIALLATGLVAVLFQPSRERLQLGVDRLFYGQRDDPLEALSQLGYRLEAAIAPEMVLPTLVETIAQTLKLPYAAIKLFTVDGSITAAQVGVETEERMELQLVYRGETVGLLLAGKRGAGEPFSLTDRRILETLAHQAGPSVQSVQLTTELQNARLQLVTAREEERRRLRRDLHDGLGATLAALNLEAGVLRRMIRSQPEKAEEKADELKGAIRAAIEDIRRLVYELRPPTLDQLGLVAAIRAHATQYSRPQEKEAVGGEVHSLTISVEAPENLSPLPAAVEVAAYRIIQEALTNVVRHSKAGRCIVRIGMAEALTIEIIDDGIGMVESRRKNSGVGFLSMRERAVELGGTLFIEPVLGGGARVTVSLPLININRKVENELS